MIFRAAIFDMDGTLVNTLEDLADSVNEMLEHFKLPTKTVDEVRLAVGNGAMKLMERTALLGDKATDENFLIEALNYYDGCYKRRLLNKTKPYDGIIEFLTELNAKKIPLGICTNKQHFAAVEIAEKILSPIKFDAVIGDERGKPKKPDPTNALAIAKSFKVKPEEVAYFGDTSVDVQTAINAGFFPIGVTWGFRPESELLETGAKLIVHHPREILKAIEFTR